MEKVFFKFNILYMYIHIADNHSNVSYIQNILINLYL